MAAGVKFHPDVVEKDLPRIDNRIYKQILTAIEERLVQSSPLHGKPLQKSLHGCRRLRIGNFRVVYKYYPEKDLILIVAIRHRSEVYAFAEKRL